MKQRTLEVVANVMGMTTKIAVLKIQSFATEPELKTWTDLVCPSCLEEKKEAVKPTYQGAGYRCEGCGFTASWWGKLARVLKGTTEKLEMPRLLGKNETSKATLYRMGIVEFSKYVDATRSERGITVKDDASARNLFKLIVAVEKLGQVLILRFNDTTEQVITLLTQSVSGRIILKEIIPINLLQLTETLRMDRSAIADKDIEEAKQFMNMIGEADEKTLKVDDYRAKQTTEQVTPVTEEKVTELKAIIQKAKQKTA